MNATKAVLRTHTVNTVSASVVMDSPNSLGDVKVNGEEISSSSSDQTHLTHSSLAVLGWSA